MKIFPSFEEDWPLRNVGYDREGGLMKFFLFLTLTANLAFAQLEPPILDGKCGKIVLKIQNDIIRAEIPVNKRLKICTFRSVDGSVSEDPEQSATIHLLPITCDGKMNGTPEFDRGNVSLNSFLQVMVKEKMGAGFFSVFTDGNAVPCRFKVAEWNRLKKIAIKR